MIVKGVQGKKAKELFRFVIFELADHVFSLPFPKKNRGKKTNKVITP